MYLGIVCVCVSWSALWNCLPQSWRLFYFDFFLVTSLSRTVSWQDFMPVLNFQWAQIHTCATFSEICICLCLSVYQWLYSHTVMSAHIVCFTPRDWERPISCELQKSFTRSLEVDRITNICLCKNKKLRIKNIIRVMVCVYMSRYSFYILVICAILFIFVY